MGLTIPGSTGSGSGTSVASPTGQAGKFLTTDGTVTSWSAIASGLTPTSPATGKAAPYNAVPGDLALMLVSGGGTVLNLPAAPADKAQVGYVAIGATTAVPLVINAGGSDTIGTAGLTSASIPLAGEVNVFQYQASSTRWLSVANVKPLTALDARYILATVAVQLAQSGQTPAQEPVAPGTSAAVGSLGFAAHADHVHPGAGVFAVYGGGGDGSVTLDGTTSFGAFSNRSGTTYTLTRAVNFVNLTINAGVTLVTNGCAVNVQGVLTNNGTIQQPAPSATGPTAVTSSAFFVNGNSTQTFGQYGKAGGTGVGTAGYSGGTATANGGGQGGAGGSGTSGAGGAAATGNPNQSVILAAMRQAPVCFLGLLSNLALVGTGANPSTFISVLGGLGGGSGAGDGTNTGGGGGGGGAVLIVNIRKLTGSGAFTSNGGNGGNGTAGNTGGGGGGGGGVVVVNTTDATGWTGTITAAGGTGGTGFGTGVAGSAGTAGIAQLNVLV